MVCSISFRRRYIYSKKRHEYAAFLFQSIDAFGNSIPLAFPNKTNFVIKTNIKSAMHFRKALFLLVEVFCYNKVV